MGCGCKNKIDNFIDKYGDEKLNKQPDTPFVKMVNFVIEMVILVVAGIVFLCAVPLIIIYIPITQITRKGLSFNLSSLVRKLHNTNKEIYGEQ